MLHFYACLYKEYQLKETLSMLQNPRRLAESECQACKLEDGLDPTCPNIPKDQLPLECGCNAAVDGVRDFVKASIDNTCTIMLLDLHDVY